MTDFRKSALLGLKFERKYTLISDQGTPSHTIECFAEDRDSKVRALLALRTDLSAKTYEILSKDNHGAVLKTLAGNRSKAISTTAWEQLAEWNYLAPIISVNPNTPSHVLRDIYVRFGWRGAVRGLLWRMLTLNRFDEEFEEFYKVLPLMSVKYRQAFLDEILENSVAFLETRRVFVDTDPFFDTADHSVSVVYGRMFHYLTGQRMADLPLEWAERIVEQFILSPTSIDELDFRKDKC